MKPALSTASAIIVLLLASCASTRPQAPSAPPSWVHEPSGGTALHAGWWKAFGDPVLNDLVVRGWNNNPEIEGALRRVEAARAERFEAMAALFPEAGLTAGFREGREQNRMTNYRPDDLEPWTAAGEISWEIDITGKLGARLAAAEAAEGAAYARWRGARLMIASEIALARFEDLVLSSEVDIQSRQLASEEKALGMTDALLQRGLVSSSDRSLNVSGVETIRRELSELERLRGLARLRLDRLCGGGTGLPTPGKLPRIPDSPIKSPAAVWGSRPDLVAAEADLRAAFAIHDAARLDLLPTLSLGAGGGLGTNTLSGQLRTWELSAGPRLEIPVWDPGRIAALKKSKAAAGGAAAEYRATSLKAVEEVEGAYLNFSRRRGQLASIEREQATARTAWTDAQAKTSSGAGSFPDENLAGRRYRDASRMASRLRLQLLDDYLALVRALGG